VHARLRAGLTLPDVLRALFPCGSITGAPKLRSMDLIAQLETQARGLYCGAIGWVDAPAAGQVQGDFCLSVAIRTLVLDAKVQAHRRAATLGVGGGVVADSDRDDEYQETRAKLRFLTGCDPGFTLFETLRVQHGRIRLLAWHWLRLSASARYFGFRLDADAVQTQLHALLHTLTGPGAYRVRLDLAHDGSCQLQHAPLAPLARGPLGLVLSSEPVAAHEAMLCAHKTSARSCYDSALKKALALGAFDVLFPDGSGGVAEGARSTLLARLDGQWCTPPLHGAVLPGVMRSRLLQRCANVQQRSIGWAELELAQELVVGNALRGLRRAVLLRDPNGHVLRI